MGMLCMFGRWGTTREGLNTKNAPHRAHFSCSSGGGRRRLPLLCAVGEGAGSARHRFVNLRGEPGMGGAGTGTGGLGLTHRKPIPVDPGTAGFHEGAETPKSSTKCSCLGFQLLVGGSFCGCTQY